MSQTLVDAAPVSSLTLSSLVIALAVVLFMSLLTGWVGLRIAGPLNRFTEAVSAYERHAPGPAPPVEEPNEVGQLARAFVLMRSTLEQREAALNRANRDLQHFTQMVAHDLREPARRTAALADLLKTELQQTDGTIPPETLLLCEQLSQQGERMLGQVTAFRMLSGISSEVPALTTIDLDDLVAQLRNDLSDRLAARRVDLRCSPLGEVQGYAGMLQAALRNLLLNALKHANDDGFRLEIAREDTSDEVILSVCNTASDVPDTELDAIFSPFHRATAATDGNGLGLAIVRRVTDLHQGRAWAERHEGRFCVRLALPLPLPSGDTTS